MIRFKRLTNKELKNLEQEFIRFLIVQGIDSKDWEKVKKTNPEKSRLLLDQFSNLVLEKALKKIRFLEYHTPKKIATLHCADDMMKLIVIEVAENSDVDLTDHKHIQHLLQSTGDQVKMYQSEKSYFVNREDEIFSYTEKGWLVSDGQLFHTLLKACN